jgi:hypothetical protein
MVIVCGQAVKRGGRRWLGPRRCCWPLLGRLTTLGHRLAGIGCSLTLYCVVWKKRNDEKRMLQEYVSNISEVCCKCYIDVAKVDQDVTHVVMVIHVYFKCMFQIFYLLQTYVASDLSRCCKSRSDCYIYMHVASIFCKYFIWMMHIFAMIF